MSKDGEINPGIGNHSPKLCPYFQAHTIEIPTEYPMKQVLHKLETSGRLMKWAIDPLLKITELPTNFLVGKQYFLVGKPITD